MKSRIQKVQLAIFLVTCAILATVWAVNGFEQTWLYACLVIVIVPNEWWIALVNTFRKEHKG